MTIDYCRLNQVVTPISAAAPHVDSSYYSTSTQPLALAIQLRTHQMFLSLYWWIGTARSSLLLPDGDNSTSLLSFLRATSTSTLSAYIIYYTSIANPVWYSTEPHVDWTWWAGSCKYSRQFSKMHACQRMEGNPTKIQRTTTLIDFLDVQVAGSMLGYTSNVKDIILHLAPPLT